MPDIKVGIDYEGTEAGADQMAALVTNLAKADSEQKATKASADALSRSQKEQTRKTERLTAALDANISGWGAIGTSIGQVGAALGRAGPEFGRFGAVLGQAGQSVQQVATALAAPTPASVASALLSVGTTLVDGIGAWVDYRDAMDRARAAAGQTAQTLTQTARAVRDARTAAEGAREATDLDLAAAAVQQRRLELSRAQLRVDQVRSAGSAEDFTRAEGQRRVLQGALDRAIRSEQEITSELQSQATARTRATQEESRLARFRAEQAQTLAEQEAVLGAQEGGRGGGGARSSTFEADLARGLAQELAARTRHEANLEALAVQAFAMEEARWAEELAARDLLEEKARADFEAEIERVEELSQKRADARDAEKEASRTALEERRREHAEIAGSLTQITQAVMGAFQSAIEGEQSLEEALAQATKELLKQFGQELVAKGIGKMLEGIAEIPSPTAATKIGGGAAMVAFGIGLGAAGAAIPSATSGAPAEGPREEARGGDSGGPTTLVLNVNSPVMAASTHAQLARGLRSQLGRDRTFPASASRR